MAPQPDLPPSSTPGLFLCSHLIFSLDLFKCPEVKSLSPSLKTSQRHKFYLFFCSVFPGRQKKRRSRWSHSLSLRWTSSFSTSPNWKSRETYRSLCYWKMETILHILSVTLFLQLLDFFCVVFRPTSSSAAAASWPFVWPPKWRLSLLISAGCVLAVSGTFCCFLPRNVTAFSFFCVFRQANGLPDSSPSHQHGQRLLLEVDQRLCRLGARLQAQLWRSEESLCVSATGVKRLWQCRWGKRLKNMRGGKKINF